MIGKEGGINYKLLIAGSRSSNLPMEQYAHFCVDHARTHGWHIIVGDCPKGVDKHVVDRANEIGYSNITVMGIAKNPRNGGVKEGQYVKTGRSYTDRDQAMVDAIDHGRCMYIWDGKSPGTKKGADYARSLDKNLTLFDFSSTF